MKKGRIGVVGSNMIDLVTYTDRMPGPGETIEAPDFELGFGGKGANQAVAAARLGSQVMMVTCVGDDMFGHQQIARGVMRLPATRLGSQQHGKSSVFLDGNSGDGVHHHAKFDGHSGQIP